MKERRKPIYRTWFLAVWALFTVSLTVWWIIFGLRQLDLMHSIGAQTSLEILRGHRMLLWEGGTLVVSLLIGALSFYFLGLRERRQSDAIQKFLLTFTHELKTPIASLRLQAEELADRLRGSGETKLLERLISDTSRLTLQLDNSLFVASLGPDQLLTENVDIAELLDSMRDEWPKLRIAREGNARVESDKRALESIFRNLFQNAVVHGASDEINITINESEKPTQITVRVCDNGRGFRGDIRKVGRPFERQYSGSGSGIGLYLVHQLSSMMGGEANPTQSTRGFCLELTLPGSVIAEEKR